MSEFVPSIVDLTPEDKAKPVAPPKRTFGDKIRDLFQNLSVKRFFRREWAKAKYREARRHNVAGTKMVKRWYKAKHGTKAESAEAAWSWYEGLHEPKLRAGASRYERERAQA
jgi:hypothetical protein